MDIYKIAQGLHQINQAYVLATIVKTEGSVPGKVGFKILIESDEKTHGTVGGGALEKEVISIGLERLKGGESGTEEYELVDTQEPTLKNKTAKIIPMMCHGKVWIFYEVTKKLTPVHIFGGGHVGHVLSYFLRRMSFWLTLIDNREQFANSIKNPYFHEHVLADYAEYCMEFIPDNEGFLIIVTQGHRYDYDILKAVYQRNIRSKYVGVIASKTKASKLIQQLKKDFSEKLDLSNLYTPIGIDLGGSTDSEIALSIAAEIQAIQHNRKVNHLKIFTSSTK
jgi:xanthine dehydrogenase accessory factor